MTSTPDDIDKEQKRDELDHQGLVNADQRNVADDLHSDPFFSLPPGADRKIPARSNPVIGRKAALHHEQQQQGNDQRIDTGRFGHRLAHQHCPGQ